MARVVAFGGLKGGSGKSTLACNVALGLASRGRRVAFVDADTQGTATAWLADSPAVQFAALGLEAEGAVGAWLGRIERLAAGADLLVLDLPPHLRVVSEAGLVVADLLVLPVRASAADLLPLQRAVDLAREARAARGGVLPGVLLVPSQIDTRRAVDREIGEALKGVGEPIGPTVGARSAFVDSFGTWVGSYAPGSKAAAEIEALMDAIERRVSV